VPDAGTITSHGFSPETSLVTFQFADLGVSGSLAINGGNPGGSPADSLELRGTEENDHFTVTSSRQLRIFKSEPGGQPARTVPITTSNITEVTLEGLGGDDTFDVPGNQPYALLVIDGGDPSASDVVNFTASATVANLVTADLGAGTVQESTFAAVTLTASRF